MKIGERRKGYLHQTDSDLEDVIADGEVGEVFPCVAGAAVDIFAGVHEGFASVVETRHCSSIDEGGLEEMRENGRVGSRFDGFIGSAGRYLSYPAGRVIYFSACCGSEKIDGGDA